MWFSPPIQFASEFFIDEIQVRLNAGGNRIRTIGPA